MTLRALAPAGVPFTLADLAAGVLAAFRGEASLDAFRRRVSAFCGEPRVFLYSSGRGAIRMGLQGLARLRPGRDEVLIPAFTSFSVPSAVVNAGFKVALYDLDPATLSPDMASLEAAFTDRTLCVVVCHLYGFPADMDPVLALARERDVPVFDDAAQAMGARYRGRLAGTMGDLGLFSLSRGKNISAVDGGVLVTADERLAETLAAAPPVAPSPLARLRIGLTALALCLLLHPRLYWLPRALPWLKLGESRFDPDFAVTGLTPFQAGLASRMLARLGRINEARRIVAGKWRRRLPADATPEPVPGAEPVWLRVPVLADCRAMPEWGVTPTYPTSLDAIPGLAPYLRRTARYPGAERLARRTMTLPTHGYVTDGDIETVADAEWGGR